MKNYWKHLESDQNSSKILPLIEENNLLLDVGDTLVSITKPFDYYTGQAIESVLKIRNSFSSTQFYNFLNLRNEIRSEAHRTERETPISLFLERAFRENLSIDLSENELKSLELVYIQAELKITELFDDAVNFLARAKNSGKNLFLTTNNFSEAHVLSICDQFGFSPYISGIHVSASCSYRKPHEGFLRTFFEKFKVKPSESVILGDKYEMDILCGKRAGIKTCLVNRNSTKIEAGMSQPDYTFESLGNITFS